MRGRAKAKRAEAQRITGEGDAGGEDAAKGLSPGEPGPRCTARVEGLRHAEAVAVGGVLLGRRQAYTVSALVRFACRARRAEGATGRPGGDKPLFFLGECP